jgi:outer membrane biosynthesis protein TonB
MKLIHVAIGMLAASFAPSAGAQTFAPSSRVEFPFASAAAVDYAVTVETAGALAAPPGIAYPYAAASRGLAGDCELRVTTDAAGAVTQADLVRCSRQEFAREAKRAALAMRYPAGAAMAEAPLTLSWRMTGVSRQQTALAD